MTTVQCRSSVDHMYLSSVSWSIIIPNRIHFGTFIKTTCGGVRGFLILSSLLKEFAHPAQCYLKSPSSILPYPPFWEQQSVTSFWGDAYTIRKWTRNLHTKIRKCVPTKINRETNAAFPHVLFEICWDRLIFCVHTLYASLPWFCIQLDFYVLYAEICVNVTAVREAIQ